MLFSFSYLFINFSSFIRVNFNLIKHLLIHITTAATVSVTLTSRKQGFGVSYLMSWLHSLKLVQPKHDCYSTIIIVMNNGSLNTSKANWADIASKAGRSSSCIHSIILCKYFNAIKSHCSNKLIQRPF